MSLTYQDLFDVQFKYTQGVEDLGQLMNLHSIVSVFLNELSYSIKDQLYEEGNTDQGLNSSEEEIKEDSQFNKKITYNFCKIKNRCSLSSNPERLANFVKYKYQLKKKENKKQARKSLPFQCPAGCRGNIAQHEIKDLLGEAVIEELEKIQQASLLSQNQNLVSCSCGNIMEVVQGEIDYNQKDDMGQAISREAAVHLSKFRIRCLQCQKNFCSNCCSEPYHTGKTCEQFKEFQNARKCRFCNEKVLQAPPSMKPAFKDVCRKPHCIKLMSQTCDKILRCGHPCNGTLNEQKCLPCLDEHCVKENEQLTLGQNAESYCTICYTEGLGAAPCVQLDCQHIFHLDCILSKIQSKWPTPRISFAFLECPSCKTHIKASNNKEIEKELKEPRKMYDIVLAKALERANAEGIDKDERLKNPGDQYFNDLKSYVLQRLSFYQCFECQQPYYGGRRECGQNEEQQNEFKKEDLVCGSCTSKKMGLGKGECLKHGNDYIEFKCRYCCKVALWFCFGTTHFCESCHQRASNPVVTQCLGMGECPLGIGHPANGQEFALGCGLCKNNIEKAFENDGGVGIPRPYVFQNRNIRGMPFRPIIMAQEEVKRPARRPHAYDKMVKPKGPVKKHKR
eukprot:403367593